ncbi:MAG: class II aldolase/adducin family protein [bacterium]|nr:class II aldolase/adducin family protein [bacterium]
MSQDEKEQREAICEIGKLLYSKGLIAGMEGNISCRLSSGEILITPAGVCKGYLKPQQIALIRSDNKNGNGSPAPSSEYRIHLTAYKLRKDINAVVHAHPSYATAFAIAGMDIEGEVLPEFVATFGEIPLVPYAEPGSVELAETFGSYLSSNHTYLLERHGLVSLADDLWKAFYRLEMAEHCAKSLYLAEQLWTLRDLNDQRDDEDFDELDAEIQNMPFPRERRRREN